MKKVALVTFHTALSIGAQLQAFALQEAIRTNGYDCQIINYTPPTLNTKSRLTLSRRIYAEISNFFFSQKINNLNARFNDWKSERLRCTEMIPTFSQLKEKADLYEIFVCGSDQIWRNPSLGYYFLDFVPDSASRIAYAPSFGNINFDEKSREAIKEYLNRFDFLSVRETDGAQFAANIVGRDIPQVLDPTLLWTAKFWRQFALDVGKKLPKKYLLVFSIQDTITCLKVAKTISSRLGIPLIFIDSARRLIWHPLLKNFFDVGPAEFLTLVDRADFIVTSSFHGTAFAVNFGKRFLTICRKGLENVNSRIVTLADILNMSDRLISPDEAIPRSVFDELCPETHVRLKRERERCQNILKKSLLLTSPQR